MVGDGPDRSSAEWLVNSKGLQSRVQFLGKQERVHELLPVADLMIMPSELESFGLAALEAMACKVPTIATRVGGVSELIEDDITGRLFAVGDVSAMAIAAVELLSDEDSLRTMGDAGRRAAQDRYCASRIIPIYEQYYERVLARAEV
jgi:glycosyltransferase involved in cell wall biosynthesis